MWLLTVLVLAMAVAAAWHNVDQVSAARTQLAQARSEHVVGCQIVIGPQPGSSSLGCPTVGGSASTNGPGSPGSSGSPTPNLPRPSLQQIIRSNIVTAQRSLHTTLAALEPQRRAELGAATFGSLPGVVLAVLLACLLIGGDYTYRTWKTQLGAGVSRASLLAGKLVALWTTLAAWLVATVEVTLSAYAVLGPGHGISAWGTPQVPALALFSSWVAPGLFATIAALCCLALRSALGGVVASGVLVAALVGIDILSKGKLVFLPGTKSPTNLPGLHAPAALNVLGVVGRLVSPGTSGGGAAGVTTMVGIHALGNGFAAAAALAILTIWVGGAATLAFSLFRRQEIR